MCACGSSLLLARHRLKFTSSFLSHSQGIEISTAEERKLAQVTEAMRQADLLEQQQEEISYVLVPADSSKPLQQLQCKRTKTTTGDVLLQHLKIVFAAGSENVDVGLLQQQPTQTLTGQETPTVSDATLRQVAAEGHAESFSLVHPVPGNNFTGINMYLDEVGMLKRLPLNQRASDYAAQAGYNPPPVFYGDVYLGRVKQKPVVTNLPFLLGPDTAMTADWLRAAASQNLDYQHELNERTGRDALQPEVAGGGGVPAEEVGFSWTQTEQELEVVVKLPETATSRDVKVAFKPQSMQVTCGKNALVAEQLFERVDVDACTWTLEGEGEDRKLIISMEKQEDAFWPRIRD
jgi:hypothetical protein